MAKLTKKQLASKERLYNDVDKNWPLRKGKNEFLKHLSGEQVTRHEALLAQCYHCSYGYEDGPYDCECAICPIYDYHPYRTERARKEITPEQRELLIERLARGRAQQKAKREIVI